MMTTTDHDGNAFLGIAIGLAFTAAILGTLWLFLGHGAWPYIGFLTLVAALLFFGKIAFGVKR
jgi:hypothetical protein